MAAAAASAPGLIPGMRRAREPGLTLVQRQSPLDSAAPCSVSATRSLEPEHNTQNCEQHTIACSSSVSSSWLSAFARGFLGTHTPLRYTRWELWLLNITAVPVSTAEMGSRARTRQRRLRAQVSSSSHQLLTSGSGQSAGSELRQHDFCTWGGLYEA